MKALTLVAAYNFEPAHHVWLTDLDRQNQLIPEEVTGPVLFSVIPTLDENGQYKGHSYVRCYEFVSKPARVVPNGGPVSS